MIDETERARWEKTYLEEALKFPAARASRAAARRWARSMSLIADQLCDAYDDGDREEAEV